MIAAAEFRPASELPPSTLTREEELEGIINDQASQLEALRQGPSQAPSRAQPPSLDVLAKMAELLQQNQELNEKLSKQERQIEKLVKDNGELQQAVHDIRELAKANRKVDNKIVNDLEDKVEEMDSIVNGHADALNKLWQLSKKQVVPNGKKSIARLEQLKNILKSGPRTFGDLERLLKISPKEMNRLVARLDSRSYEVFFRAGDGRQKVLRLKNRINTVNTFDVKCQMISEEGEKEA